MMFPLLLITLRAAVAQAGIPCVDIARANLPGIAISEAKPVAANVPFSYQTFGAPVLMNSLPAHCLVHGEVNHHKGVDGKEYGDKFELRMPAVWKGRLLFEGGGGLDGLLAPAIGPQGAAGSPSQETALSLGYAVVTDDGGHQASSGLPTDGSFGVDPDARADYNYRSTRLVSDAVRAIITKFYGSAVKHAYFRGCSNGGREGMKAAEMYPDYFDGVIAGAPAFHLTHAAMAQAWTTQQLASIAPRGPEGRPDLSQSLTEGDLKLLTSAVARECDKLDGVEDGLIFNTQACHFDPAVLQCHEGASTACLSEKKVEVIRNIVGGPRDSAGTAIYAAFPYDTGMSAAGWRMWTTGTPQMPSFNAIIFPSFFNGLALAGVPPPIDDFHFNFDKDPARVEKASAEIDATSTDWSGFRKHHGKLLLYTGMSDPVFSPLDLIDYYRRLTATNGDDFARLFLVPGMNHCGGGPSLDDFDALGAMQRWVEEGTGPNSIPAKGIAFAGRTRPLCAYPNAARYSGHGNPEDAKNFTCEVGGKSAK